MSREHAPGRPLRSHGTLRALVLVGAAIALAGAATTIRPHDPDRPPAGPPAAFGAGAPPVGAGASPAATPLVDLGPTAATREVRFELVLAFPGRDAMLAYAQAVSDPRSAQFRDFLTAGQIGARFGLADADLARVTDWAASHDLSVVGTSPQRIAVSVGASAATVSRWFGVHLHEYRDGTGRTYRAPDAVPSIPSDLAGLVVAVEGLDERPVERPAFSRIIAAGPSGGMTPSIVDRAYELEGLRQHGLHGEGQTVAIVSLDGFDPADVTSFDTAAGISGPAVERIKVNGGVATPGDGQGEVNLDIDVLRALAPQAQILDYEAPNKGGAIAAIVDQIVKDARTEIVTISWGSCELSRSSAGLERMASSMAAAALAGITVYVASGDHGVYDCLDTQRSDLRVAVDSPAADPNVVAVGGTYLSMAADGTYLDEVAWVNPLIGWGTGGGLSVIYPRPAWQTGSGVVNAGSNGMRQVPDVSAAADQTSGFLTVSEGHSYSGGGTSAASPFWAGFTVLVRQLADREGVRHLGPLAKTLYEVAAAQPAGSVFHDITRGSNLVDDAGPGWDYATGLGSPRCTPLARAIVDHLKGS